MASEALTRALDDSGASYELLPHARTESALAEAEALGIDPGDVGKTLVVETPEGNVRAVAPAACRIDFGKLSELVGTSKHKVHLASEEALARDYPEFELGAVPPLGGLKRDKVIVDNRLAERTSVVLEAGVHDESLRVSASDLVRVTRAEVADICED